MTAVAALLVTGALLSVPLVILAGFGALAGDHALYTMTVVLLAVPALALWLSGLRSLRWLAAGLLLGGVPLVAVLLWPTPDSPGPAQTQARLRTIASQSPEPIYYLGPTFQGQPLDEASASRGDETTVGDDSLDPGQSLDVSYGVSCPDHTCSSSVDIMTDRAPGSGPQPCTNVPPLRGVPALRLPDEVLLFTGGLVAHLRGPGIPTDLAQVSAMATALRAVGQLQPTGRDFPPPRAKPPTC